MAVTFSYTLLTVSEKGHFLALTYYSVSQSVDKILEAVIKNSVASTKYLVNKLFSGECFQVLIWFLSNRKYFLGESSFM